MYIFYRSHILDVSRKRDTFKSGMLTEAASPNERTNDLERSGALLH
jgi:hypothetical protein